VVEEEVVLNQTQAQDQIQEHMLEVLVVLVLSSSLIQPDKYLKT
jgi:hypothetical protein|tara:strand:- start:5 stop:136 length:132 start_codon:yes stop_codon:yes gene_type:complete